MSPAADGPANAPANSWATSRAMQEVCLRSCVLVDTHGRPVPLGSAGYLLVFGRAYHLRVTPPWNDQELKSVRIVSAPDFIQVDPEFRDRDESDRPVRVLPFKVRNEFGSHFRKVGMDVRCDDLQILCDPRDGIVRETPPYHCPIVVRAPLVVVFVAILLGVVGTIIPSLATELVLKGSLGAGGVLGFLFQLVTNWVSLVWLGVITLAVIVIVNVCNLAQMYWRSRELRRRFHERYGRERGSAP